MQTIGVGVGAVIWNEAGELLLFQRKKAPEVGHFSIPGGKVDWMETIEEAVVREIEEELGVKVSINTLLGVTNHRLPEEGIHYIAPTFHVEIEAGELVNREPEKHGHLAFYPLDQLPQPLTLTTQEALRMWHEKNIDN